MRLGQHGNVFPFDSIVVKLFYQFFQQRIVDLFKRLFYRKRYTGIINILGGKAKMNKLFICIKTANLIKLFLNIILYGLHIMICDFLDVFHTLSILRSQCTVNVAKPFKKRVIKTL